MNSERSPLPRKLEANLLYANEHTCCICREKGKDVQIHHIVGDHENNKWSNLAVLCLDCHSKVTGRRGLGRRFSPDEVRQYKEFWERAIKRSRNLLRSERPAITKVEESLLRFEIKKLVYELASVKSLKRVKDILEFLEVTYVFESKSRMILEQLYWIVPFVSGSRKGRLVAEYVPIYLEHLVGPEDVKLSKGDIGALEEAVSLLVWMGEMEGIGVGTTSSIGSVIQSLRDLYETAGSYKLTKIQNQIVKGVKSVKKELGGSWPKKNVDRRTLGYNLRKMGLR